MVRESSAINGARLVLPTTWRRPADGVNVLPWMLCGTNEIGVATAEQMKTARLVVWSQHGIYGAGADLDETFGLIETAK